MFFSYNSLAEWMNINEAREAGVTPNHKSVNNVTKYEITWAVPFGSRKVWIAGAKITIKIRDFLKEGIDVSNIEIKRLESKIFLELGDHKHWINELEIKHDWDICDLNPENFVYSL